MQVDHDLRVFARIVDGRVDRETGRVDEVGNLQVAHDLLLRGNADVPALPQEDIAPAFHNQQKVPFWHQLPYAWHGKE